MDRNWVALRRHAGDGRGFFSRQFLRRVRRRACGHWRGSGNRETCQCRTRKHGSSARSRRQHSDSNDYRGGPHRRIHVLRSVYLLETESLASGVVVGAAPEDKITFIAEATQCFQSMSAVWPSRLPYLRIVVRKVSRKHLLRPKERRPQQRIREDMQHILAQKGQATIRRSSKAIWQSTRFWCSPCCLSCSTSTHGGP